MLDKSAYYHGAAVIPILEDARCSSIRKRESLGYVVNNDIFLFIKYTTKARPPWRFTFDQEDIDIFVGGNKLGRGVTIPNLITSYYGRNPKRPNSDTVLQHARMYGYRQAHIGVTRLFLPEKLAEHFRIIHQMEEALRALVEKHPQGKFEGIYLIHLALDACTPRSLPPFGKL